MTISNKQFARNFGKASEHFFELVFPGISEASYGISTEPAEIIAKFGFSVEKPSDTSRNTIE